MAGEGPSPRSGLFAVGVLPPGTQPSLVIAAGITVLLSGLSVVGTVQDAISSYYVTAAGRAAEIALLSAGLLTGVILRLRLDLLLGLTLDPAETSPGSASRRSPPPPRPGCSLWPVTRRCARCSAELTGGIGWSAYGGVEEPVTGGRRARAS